MCCVVSDEEVLCGSHESMEKATEVIHARYCVFFWTRRLILGMVSNKGIYDIFQIYKASRLNI